MNIKKAIVPDIKGDTTQLETIEPTLDQLTASTLIPTAAKPTIAPTIECVVDTGQPLEEAINNQVPAASNAANIPNTSKSGVA